MIYLGAAVLHGLNHTLLQVFDDVLDLANRFLGSLGQMTN
jgi:hypothetical protein